MSSGEVTYTGSPANVWRFYSAGKDLRIWKEHYMYTGNSQESFLYGMYTTKLRSPKFPSLLIDSIIYLNHSKIRRRFDECTSCVASLSRQLKSGNADLWGQPLNLKELLE